MTKPRINIHVPTDLYALLCEETRRPGVTKTAIMETALRAYFCPDSKLGLEERLLDRLDNFDIRQGAIERDIAVCFETLCQYVLFWLTRMEPIPDGERDAAQALGMKRYDQFLMQVAKKLQSHSTGTNDRLHNLGEDISTDS